MCRYSYNSESEVGFLPLLQEKHVQKLPSEGAIFVNVKWHMSICMYAYTCIHIYIYSYIFMYLCTHVDNHIMWYIVYTIVMKFAKVIFLITLGPTQNTHQQMVGLHQQKTLKEKHLKRFKSKRQVKHSKPRCSPTNPSPKTPVIIGTKLHLFREINMLLILMYRRFFQTQTLSNSFLTDFWGVTICHPIIKGANIWYMHIISYLHLSQCLDSASGFLSPTSVTTKPSYFPSHWLFNGDPGSL